MLWWYVARGAGIVSWSLLATSVLVGLVLSTHVLGRRPRANWLLDLHRFLGGLAVVFVGVHVASILVDSYVDFAPVDVLVPLASSWRPVAVAGGVVSLYLLVAIEVTSLLRAQLPARVWRGTHYLSIPLFALATMHGLTAGTDRSNLVLVGSALVAVAVATTLLFVRVLQVEQRQPALAGRRMSPAHADPRRREEWS